MTHATGTSEQSIPHGPTDPTLPVQEYQISVDTTDGFLNFYFSVAPDDFSPTKDQPLEFRVPPAGPCCITIQLDPNLNWEFRYKVGDPIMLASPNNPPDGPAANRYSQLNWGFAANGKCQTVSFDATLINIWPTEASHVRWQSSLIRTSRIPGTIPASGVGRSRIEGTALPPIHHRPCAVGCARSRLVAVSGGGI